jgi:hypothetical protein
MRPGGRARLVKELGDPAQRERTLARRLDDNRVAGGDGRRRLVRVQLDRIVEWDDRRSRMERLAEKPKMSTCKSRIL